MEVNGQHHAPATFRPSDNPDNHRTEGWLGLRADLGVLEKGKNILSCWKSKSGSSRARPSRYTEYVIPASPRYCYMKSPSAALTNSPSTTPAQHLSVAGNIGKIGSGCGQDEIQLTNQKRISILIISRSR